MPMYYFSLRDQTELADLEGTDLPDLDAAREHATGVARELMFKRDGMLNRNWSQWTMTVQDSAGQEVLSFPLSDFSDSRPE